MSERMRMLSTFAILGFIMGVVANFSGRFVIPWIIEHFPAIFMAEWVLSGLAGAFLTVVFVIIWAYITPSEK